MNPGDVGSEKILNSIKKEIKEILDHSLKINMICYCQQLLTKYNSESMQSQIHCHLCQESLGYMSYDCNNASCIYKSTSEQQFRICTSCYKDGSDVTLSNTKDGWKQMFASKLKSNISTMSQVNSIFLPLLIPNTLITMELTICYSFR